MLPHGPQSTTLLRLNWDLTARRDVTYWFSTTASGELLKRTNSGAVKKAFARVGLPTDYTFVAEEGHGSLPFQGEG